VSLSLPALETTTRSTTLRYSNLPKGLDALDRLDGGILTEGLARCINIIEGSDVLPTKMPRGVAKRHKFCTELGKRMKGLGFNGDCGFQQFMYPNARDSRRMLVFCVNKLPKNEDEEEDEVDGAADLNRSIKSALKRWGSEFWRMDGHQPRHIVRASPLEVVESKSSATQYYYHEFMPLLSEQPLSKWDVAASVFELDAKEVAIAAAKEAEWDEDENHDEKKKRDMLKSSIRSAFAGMSGLVDLDGDDSLKFSKMPSLADLMAQLRGERRGQGGAGSRFGKERMFGTEADQNDAVVPSGAVVGEDGNKLDPVEAAKQRKLAQQKEDERQLAEWEKELEDLAKQIAEATQAAKRDAASKEAAETTCRRRNADLMKSLSETKSLERAYKVKEQTLKMLPDATNNIAKLQTICQKSASSLIGLSAQWEKVRRTLIESYRHIKEAHTLRKHACKEKVRKMKEMRAEMKGMAGELRQKEARLKFLLKEFAKLPKSVNRTLYTSRIMAIIDKVRKQNMEIDRVIEQIHDVQKDINEVGQKLLRTLLLLLFRCLSNNSNEYNNYTLIIIISGTEKLTDHRMFQVASQSKDRAYVDAYRHLKDIRDAFEALVVNVQKIGRIDNDMVVTRNRIAQMKARNTDKNMKQMQKDLAEVRKENEALQNSS